MVILISGNAGNVIELAKGGIMPELPKWESWTVSEASKETGYNQEYVRRLIRNEEIEAVKIGSVWLINAESLKDYIKKVEDIDDNRYGPKQK